MEKKINVLIVDDQKELTQSLKTVLETDERIRVVAVAHDGVQALACMSQRPDVVLMDIRMPNMNGVAATHCIKTEYPDTKVLVLTTFDDSDYILDAINYGASGYLLKDISGNGLIEAVKNAYEGDIILPGKIAKRIADAAKNVEADREIKLSRTFQLSEREIEIAMMMAEGFTNGQISVALRLSEGTTRNYVSAIYEKTGADNRAAAIQAIKAVL